MEIISGELDTLRVQRSILGNHLGEVQVDEIIKNYKLGRSPQPRHIQSDFAAQRQHAGSELLPEVAGSIDVDYAWPAG